MTIRMNEEKISTSSEYTVEHIYQALDSIFSKYGMDRTETDRGIEYVGHNRPTDFAYFGKIMLGLKELQKVNIVDLMVVDQLHNLWQIIESIGLILKIVVIKV